MRGSASKSLAWGHSSFAITLAIAGGQMSANDAAGQKLRERVRAEAQRALALDPKDAMAYFLLFGLETSPHGRESVILKGLSVDPHPAIFVGGLYGWEGADPDRRRTNARRIALLEASRRA
jgi:hypothetical protein